MHAHLRGILEKAAIATAEGRGNNTHGRHASLQLLHRMSRMVSASQVIAGLHSKVCVFLNFF